MSCLLIIPSVPTVWKEAGNTPDSGDKDAWLNRGWQMVTKCKGGELPGLDRGLGAPPNLDPSILAVGTACASG